jgi:hypothetical protein
MSCFSAKTTVDVNVGGSKNRMEPPNTRVKNKCTKVTKREGQKIPKSMYSPQKL